MKAQVLTSRHTFFEVDMCNLVFAHRPPFHSHVQEFKAHKRADLIPMMGCILESGILGFGAFFVRPFQTSPSACDCQWSTSVAYWHQKVTSVLRRSFWLSWHAQ